MMMPQTGDSDSLWQDKSKLSWSHSLAFSICAANKEQNTARLPWHFKASGRKIISSKAILQMRYNTFI